MFTWMSLPKLYYRCFNPYPYISSPSGTNLQARRMICDNSGCKEFTLFLNIGTHAKTSSDCTNSFITFNMHSVSQTGEMNSCQFCRRPRAKQVNQVFHACVTMPLHSPGSHPGLKFVRKFNLSPPFPLFTFPPHPHPQPVRQAHGHLNQNQMYLSGRKITNSSLRGCQW